MRVRFVAVAAVSVSVSLGVPAIALAQTPPSDPTRAASARELAEDARDAYDAGDYAKALDLYRRAVALVPAPTLVLREARCLAKLGRLVEASELYVRVVQTPIDASSPSAYKTAVDEGGAELDALRPRIPMLKVSVSGARWGAVLDLRLDGQSMPAALMDVERPLDPGDHTVDGTIDQRPVAAQHVHATEGQHLQVVVRPTDLGDATAQPPPAAAAPPASNAAAPAASTEAPAPAPRDRGSAQRTLGWAAIGVGAAGVLTGVIAGVVSTGHEHDLENECPAGRCPPSAQSDLDAFRTTRTISTVGYVVGAVGLAAGVVLVLTAPRRAPSVATNGASSARVGAFVGVGSAGVAGAF